MRLKLTVLLITLLSFGNPSEARPRRGQVSKRVMAALVTASLIAGYLPGQALAKSPDHPAQICKVFEQHPAWRTAAEKASAKHQVPVAEFMAINFAESTLDPAVKNKGSSASGLCQATNATWKDYKRANPEQAKADRFDATDCIDFSAWRVRNVSDTVNQGRLLSPAEAAKAYKAGPGGYLKGIPDQQPGEYRAYAKKVARTAHKYQQDLASCAVQIDAKALAAAKASPAADAAPRAESPKTQVQQERGFGGKLSDFYFERVKPLWK